MSRSASARIIAGNAAVIALLLAIAGLLLRLHLGENWWLAAPLPARRWIALAALLAYAAGCAALWWHARPRQDDATEAGEPPLLVVWASQTGFARQLAEHTAQSLRDGGCRVRLRALDQVDAALLGGTRKALFVASTTGEGDPPDHALAFLGQVMRQAPPLPDLHYAVLALGDRSYEHYCAFGHRLDDWLRQHGARPLFDTVEVDNADPAALRHWQQLLGQFGDGSVQVDWSAPDYQPWLLRARQQLNPGSVGGPVFHLRLQPADGDLPAWQAGDIAEVGPRHAAGAVEHWMRTHDLDVRTTLADGRALREVLAASKLPDTLDSSAPDAIAAALQALPHREYSIASLPSEGSLHLLLRRQAHPDGTPGLASGWLCDDAAIGGRIDLRLRANANFHPPADDAPLVLIGNGTGIAGLRAHLRARIDAGARRNWLLFGERNHIHDFHFGDELEQWRHEGWIERLDAVFSRDGGAHRYVQDALAAQADLLRQWVDDGAAVLVCGSLQGMAPAVDAAIAQALGEERKEQLVMQRRYRRDVY
ncbi:MULTISPECIES: sulfite reductase subunit alpha [Stenotrophomonas]|uniref:NADPH--hemoprotein reductase n=1 Tax=Stenotrophomonas nitritireducens TaxID=83617 RepID=A0ABR5NGD9_9GAMM|nr:MULTISPECIES: sulfite reductase flavoprotein subunit alpha [Stenotrophomonas]KQN96451.1 sulfite reductase subunit alpha [Stenotrophomonas sp. Leaf70]KRG54746.1 sulfite reductase subunit alpha [Stenotrophomonas nitritireducens]